jgi:hypothetical protein
LSHRLSSFVSIIERIVGRHSVAAPALVVSNFNKTVAR